MNRTQKTFTFIFSLGCIVILSSFATGKVHAAVDTCTWQGDVDNTWGGGTDGVDTNWTCSIDGDTFPEDGDSLVFPSGASSLNNTNDLVGLDIVSITVDGAYTIDVGSITLGTGGITYSGNSPTMTGTSITLSGASSINTTGTATGGTVSAPINLNGFDLSFNASVAAITINSDISGTGNLTQSGFAVDLTGTNTYSGSLTINQASVNVYGGSNIPNDGCVTIASGATLSINVDDEIIGCLSGAGTVLLNGFSLETNATSSTTFTGVFTEGSGITGVSVDGPNVFTYAGGISVIDGLVVLGSGSMIADGTNGGDFSAANTTVNSGGTLELTNGIIMGLVDSSGTLILDGQSIIDNSGLSTGGTTEVVINSTISFGTVDVTGSVIVAGTFNLSGSYAPVLGDSFIIVDNDGADAVTGTFSGLPEGATINFNGGAFTISYVGGDGNDIVLTVSVPAALFSTTTTLTSSVNPTNQGQCTTFTATVDSVGGPTPTGSVSFYDGASLLGSGTLNGSGVATLQVCNLSVGSHNITASYAGDIANATSTSSILVQVVNTALATTGDASAVLSALSLMSLSILGLGALNSKNILTRLKFRG